MNPTSDSGGNVSKRVFTGEAILYHYQIPNISLLEPTQSASEQNVASEISTTGRRLVDTLNSFGVQTTYIGYSRGPAVTRYELQPAAGVKISRITSLADDISMNLAAAGIRIEAPIPGKAAVGIEVPNKNNTIVRMRELVESNSFSAAKSMLTVALGRDRCCGRRSREDAAPSHRRCHRFRKIRLHQLHDYQYAV